MVHIESLDEGTEAFVVSQAGHSDSTGLYVRTGRQLHDAPVFENDRKCLLSREPHKNQKTGETSYGWIIGQDRKPLYAVQSDSLTPPTTGWRRFTGAAPLPLVQGCASNNEGATLAAQAWKQEGNEFFAQKQYPEAETRWTRAIGLSEHIRDEAIRLALFSNRAEGRIRQQLWQGALADAESALSIKKTHEKALMRGAKAALELQMYDVAHRLVNRCIDAHPTQQEARALCKEIERLADEEARKYSILGEASREKLKDSVIRASTGADEDAVARGAGAKDTNNRRGFKAFTGYAEARKAAAAADSEKRPPLSELPYHKMGVPKDQVDLMDNFFQEMRDKRDADKVAEKDMMKEYERLKEQFKTRSEEQRTYCGAEMDPEWKAAEEIRKKQEQAREEAAEKERLEKKEKEFQARQRTAAAKKNGEVAGGTPLSQVVKDEIDSLFSSFKKKATEAVVEDMDADAKAEAELWKERIAIGMAIFNGKEDEVTKRIEDVRRAEATDGQARAMRRIEAQLKCIRLRKNGEPVKLEQAKTEVYCWWTLPPKVSASEVKVEATNGGAHLTITVRGVVIFDRDLFDKVKSADTIWTLDAGELHLTLTKAEKSKLWEQLGAVPEVVRDASGRVTSVPDAMSSSDRIEKFKQMVTGDDGDYVRYEDMDRQGRQLIDVLRRYEHARATGDKEALALAEIDLEEFGSLVI